MTEIQQLVQRYEQTMSGDACRVAHNCLRLAIMGLQLSPGWPTFPVVWEMWD